MDETVHIPALLAETFGISRSEGRRLIAQGGVRVDGVLLSPSTMDLPEGALAGAELQVGRRRKVTLSDEL